MLIAVYITVSLHVYVLLVQGDAPNSLYVRYQQSTVVLASTGLRTPGLWHILI